MYIPGVHFTPYRLSEFLPKEYVEVKRIEKIIYQEHCKHFSMSELSAKCHYIAKCRSMPTYGATFFLVKEKLKGRNKLVPCLLGISCSSVMRVDKNTKEVLQRWELTSVKRWANRSTSFTMDFGESYYSVKTSEWESLSHLLGNYIDRIFTESCKLAVRLVFEKAICCSWSIVMKWLRRFLIYE